MSPKRLIPCSSSTWRAIIDFVPRPSTTNANARESSSNTNAGSPREASSAFPPRAVSSDEVESAPAIANRLPASSVS